MTRAAFSGIAQDRAGNGLNGAQITFRAGTEADSPLASVYAAASGGSPLTQPISTDADGRLLVFVEPGAKYRIEGLSEGGAGVDIWTAPTSVGKQYPSYAAFIADTGYTPADGAVVPDGTVQHIRNSASTAYPDKAGWKPFGELCLPQHFGPVGTADDAITFTQWLLYLDSAKVKGYIPAGTYNISYLRNRNINNGIDIECHPDARIIGTITKRDFEGDGVETVFTVENYEFGEKGSFVTYVSGGSQTNWVEGVQYTMTGQTLDLSAGSAPHGALGIGDVVRVVARNPVVEIGYTSATPGKKFNWRGGQIDNSQRGFNRARGTGSALSIYNFAEYSIHDVFFNGGRDFRQNDAMGFSDSGFTPLNCDFGEIAHCKFYGQADLGIYLTGGGSTGPEDDTKQHQIYGNYFYQCQQGGKAERQVNDVKIFGNYFEECFGGFLGGGIAGGVGGGKISITNNTFQKSLRRAVDLRRVFDVYVCDNTIIDFGYEFDGVTPTVQSVGIDVSGVERGKIKGNSIRLSEWAKNDQTGIRLRQDIVGSTEQTSLVEVTGNTIENVSTGTQENNTGVGNVWRENSILDCDTDKVMPLERRWHYRKSNIDFEGIGDTPFKGTTTPTVLLSGAVNSPVYNYTTQYLAYERRGDTVWIHCKLTFNITHTETARQFRVYGLPFEATNNSDHQPAIPVGFSSLSSWPAGTTQIVGQVVGAGNFVRFRSFGNAEAGTFLDSSHITSGSTMRIEFSGVYSLAPEAQN